MSLTRASGTLVDFTLGGDVPRDASACRAANSTLPCSFSFVHAWDPALVSPTEVFATGGERIVVSGFGFSPETAYRCVLRYSEGGVLVHSAVSTDVHVDSPSHIFCASPPWPFRQVAGTPYTLNPKH